MLRIRTKLNGDSTYVMTIDTRYMDLARGKWMTLVVVDGKMQETLGSPGMLEAGQTHLAACQKLQCSLKE